MSSSSSFPRSRAALTAAAFCLLAACQADPFAAPPEDSTSFMLAATWTSAPSGGESYRDATGRVVKVDGTTGWNRVGVQVRCGDQVVNDAGGRRSIILCTDLESPARTRVQEYPGITLFY